MLMREGEQVGARTRTLAVGVRAHKSVRGYTNCLEDTQIVARARKFVSGHASYHEGAQVVERALMSARGCAS